MGFYEIKDVAKSDYEKKTKYMKINTTKNR